MHMARAILALIAIGSLVGCSSSSGLPTQRAYNAANIEQPQSVNFYCGTILAVAPAILPNSIPPGVGITPGISRWLLGVHGLSSGPNTGIQVSAGFLDLNGIASAPEAPLTEYTVMLNTGTPVVVVQNEAPELYGAPMSPSEAVGVRVVNNSYRVMRNTGLPCSRGPLSPTVLAPGPVGVTHSFLGSGGVVSVYYPSGGMGHY